MITKRELMEINLSVNLTRYNKIKSRFRIFMIGLLRYLPHNWRDFIFGFKRFRAKNRIFPSPAIIFFTEKEKCNGGFADRMKGIVSLFHFCLCKNISFKINYAVPFELSDFLLPNEYNWQIDKQQISFNRKESRFFFLYGAKDRKVKLKRLLKFTSKKQVQAFFNLDFVCELNEVFSTNYTWSELYKKLFKPTIELQNIINYHKKEMNISYISVHFRFIGLLGDFNEREENCLVEKEKIELMNKNLQALQKLKESFANKKIFVAADSNLFIEQAKKIENVYALSGNIIHIDNVEDEAPSSYLRVFLDFYLLSESEKVFSICTKEMYQSEFPMYAAKLNNIPFERILIE